MARKAKLGLFDAKLGGGQAAIRPISYQQIIEIARQVGLDQLCTDLSEWAAKKSRGSHRGAVAPR